MNNRIKQAVILIFLCQPAAFVSAQPVWIEMGKGGGVSGEISGYRIYRNGKVLKGFGLPEMQFTERARTKKSETRKIFAAVKSYTGSTFSKPGNVYYFLKVSKGGTERKYTWGDTQFNVPEPFNKIYKEVFPTLSALHYKPLKNEH
jgi:hypothetical protein